MPMNLGSGLFQKRGEFVAREIAGETILVPICGNVVDLDSIFSLNETAAFVWGRLEGRSLAELAAALATAFEVDQLDAEADVSTFLRQMLAAGIIQPCTGGS